MCVKGSSLACHGQLLWALRFNTAQLHMCGFEQAVVNQGDAQDTDLMLTTDVKELQEKICTTLVFLLPLPQHRKLF